MTPEEIKKIRIEIELYTKALEEALTYIKMIKVELDKLNIDDGK